MKLQNVAFAIMTKCSLVKLPVFKSNPLFKLSRLHLIIIQITTASLRPFRTSNFLLHIPALQRMSQSPGHFEMTALLSLETLFALVGPIGFNL